MLFLLGLGHGRNNYKGQEFSGKHDNDKISQDSTSQQTFVFCYPSISKSNGYWRGSCNRNEGTKSRASLAQIMCPVSVLDLGGPSMPASAPLITWKWSRHFRDIPAASHSSNLLPTGHLLGTAAAISAVTGHGWGRGVIYNGSFKKERSQLCWNTLGCCRSPESGVHSGSNWRLHVTHLLPKLHPLTHIPISAVTHGALHKAPETSRYFHHRRKFLTKNT